MGHMPGNFMDFANFRNMIENREYERTYPFNIMLVGEAGLGKSAIVKSLFRGKIKPKEHNYDDSNICVYSELIEENCVKMKITCIETRSFDPSRSEEVIEYIDDQFKAHLVDRIRLPTWKTSDTMVHCCLYLIPPHGHMKLTQRDLASMKALHERVNLVPILAKADCFDSDQVKKFKENIMADLQANEIKYFEFKFDIEEDEETHKIVEKYATKFPFAIVTADEATTVHNSPTQRGKLKWVRKTTAGEIDILDPLKSDFGIMSRLILRHCILDLIDSTCDKHFAKFEANLLELPNRRKVLESFDLNRHEIFLYEWMKIPGAPLPDNIYDRKRNLAKMRGELHHMELKLRHLETLLARKKRFEGDEN